MIGPATVPRWAAIAAIAPGVLLFSRDRVGGAAWAIPAALLLISGASLLWAPDALTGADDLARLAVLGVVFALGASTPDLRQVWVGLALGVSASAALAIAQVFGFDGVFQAVPPAGLFVNKNFLAEAGMVAIVASIGLGLVWAIPGAAVAAALGSSTAVVGALSVVLAIALFDRGRKVLAFSTVTAVVTVAAALFVLGTPGAAARLDIWADALFDPRWLGHGLGAFSATLPWVGYAHSEPIQLVHELGALSAPFFAVAFFALGAKHDAPVEWHVLVALCAVSLFSFPLHLPLTAFAFALAAGRCVGARAPLRLRDPFVGAFAHARA